MRIIAVDYGMKNIGLAICDELLISARQLEIIKHTTREKDAETVAELASTLQAGKIIVGVSYDESGDPNEAGRQAINFMDELRSKTKIEVIAWDESLTTKDATRIKLEMGTSKKYRKGHHDGLAAAVLLQDYIDQLGR